MKIPLTKPYFTDEESIEVAKVLESGWVMQGEKVVHQVGLSADIDPILKIAKNKNLIVVEDAACSLGATYKGKQTGSFGDIGCFSLHPRKSITTGEGGAIVTNDSKIYDLLKSLRS